MAAFPVDIGRPPTMTVLLPSALPLLRLLDVSGAGVVKLVFLKRTVFISDKKAAIFSGGTPMVGWPWRRVGRIGLIGASSGRPPVGLREARTAAKGAVVGRRPPPKPGGVAEVVAVEEEEEQKYCEKIGWTARRK
jgi:hypothetical protein